MSTYYPDVEPEFVIFATVTRGGRTITRGRIALYWCEGGQEYGWEFSPALLKELLQAFIPGAPPQIRLIEETDGQ
jgi:hypothetical protein